MPWDIHSLVVSDEMGGTLTVKGINRLEGPILDVGAWRVSQGLSLGVVHEQHSSSTLELWHKDKQRGNNIALEMRESIVS